MMNLPGSYSGRGVITIITTTIQVGDVVNPGSLTVYGSIVVQGGGSLDMTAGGNIIPNAAQVVAAITSIDFGAQSYGTTNVIGA